MSDFVDYRFKFTDLPRALAALAQLRTAGLLGQGDIPDNMLGDYRDASGNIVDRASGNVAWLGRRGVAAGSYTDPDSGETVSTPAIGDPAYWYIAIRSTVTPDQLTFDPSTFGLMLCDADENAAVLGVWA